MKSLRESFTHQLKATEAFHYPGYVIRLQKERQIQTKTKICSKNYTRKQCPPNQLNIKLITKNNKNRSLPFCAGDNICKSNDAHYCDAVKRKQKRTKRGKFAKITKISFMKTGCSKKKDHWRKKKPLWRINCISKDMN